MLFKLTLKLIGVIFFIAHPSSLTPKGVIMVERDTSPGFNFVFWVFAAGMAVGAAAATIAVSFNARPSVKEDVSVFVRDRSVGTSDAIEEEEPLGVGA